MAGVVGMGVGTRKAALSGLQRSADLEEAQENANKTLEAQYEQTQKASIGSGMATGAMIGGQVAGPYGAIVGGVIGGLFGWGASS